MSTSVAQDDPMYVCLKCGKKRAHDEAGACEDCGGPVVRVRCSGESLVGRLLANKFLLLGRLGQGGMGSVYRARQENLERTVAVKVLRLTHGDRTAALRRFYAEARNTSRLQHPHNVKVFDFGHTDDGLVFIAMELVAGRPLSSLRLPLAPERALRILRQICGGLSEAHELGLIHRDLKPDNILVSEIDGDDFVRILDYGIAKLENSSTGLTEDGQIIGTPRYMSPEQVSSEELDRRSDIYSLGCLLYELTTGRPPFLADDPIALVYMHKHERPRSPGELAPISPALEHLILDCLAKKRAKRPQTTVDLRQRVERLLDGRASDSGPVPTLVGKSAPTRHVGPDPDSSQSDRLARRDSGQRVPSRRLRLVAALAVAVVALGVTALLVLGREAELPPAPQPSQAMSVAGGSRHDEPPTAPAPQALPPDRLTSPPTATIEPDGATGDAVSMARQELAVALAAARGGVAGNAVASKAAETSGDLGRPTATASDGATTELQSPRRREEGAPRAGAAEEQPRQRHRATTASTAGPRAERPASVEVPTPRPTSTESALDSQESGERAAVEELRRRTRSMLGP